MPHRSSDKTIKVNLFSGLGLTLAVSFLMFALIPMTIISWISYQTSLTILNAETEIALKTVATLKTREIRTYFNGMLNDLRYHADLESSTRLFEELINFYRQSDKSLKNFVGSYRWTLLVDEFASDIIKFRRAYNYYDIFLISKQGDILYTVSKESDLGTNLLTGQLRSSKFAAACRYSLKTGKLAFSDYEKYSHSGGKVFGFLTYPVMNDEGNRIGIMAFQFPIGPINKIMQAENELGQSAETYLVGPDLTLRSNSILAPEKDLIQEKIATIQTKLMKQHLHEKNKINIIKHKANIYPGPHGRLVMGILQYLQIQNVNFAVIAEIEEKEAFANVDGLRRTMLAMAGLTCFLTVFFAMILVRRIIRPLVSLSEGAKNVEHGNFNQLIEINSKNEIGNLADSFNAMIDSLKKNKEENTLQNWFKTGQMELGDNMAGISDLPQLSRRIITFLAKYVKADIGAIYIIDKDKGDRLNLLGSYAFTTRKHIANEIGFGEGLIGQAALEKQRILLTEVPADYCVVQSGLGEMTPRCIVVKPLIYNEKIYGVIELGSIQTFSETALDFLDLVSDNIAVAIQTILVHLRVGDLLNETQIQAMELGVQQEELRQANESLEQQTTSLKESEAKLQAQQEELRQTNNSLLTQSAELEEQTAQLEIQKSEIQNKNIELENTRTALEKKAHDLEIAGKYKSEFLANMSHELRTPLNSILLLSKHLADNRDGNMTEKQRECAATVHTSGNELLSLINEVLDLSKVEAGQMSLEIENTSIKDITKIMERTFRPLAEENSIVFEISIAEELPENIRTDPQRLSQILKNLLANAFKFTNKGIVSLEVCRPAQEVIDLSDNSGITDKSIAFKVKDTGPGISKDKQDIIFQAFKQADGSTSRNYGGTGLGLSISLEFAKLLEGEIKLSSKEGEGSVFTLYINEILEGDQNNSLVDSGDSAEPVKIVRPTATSPESDVFHRIDTNHPIEDDEYISDDRKTVTPESRSILIIEDDPEFAQIIRDVARERNFKALVAESGETGLFMADFYIPNGIIMDMGLPGINGKDVISRLKNNLSTRHIPIHIISASDRTREPMQLGAVGYTTKPVSMETLDSAFRRIEQVLSKEIKEVLLVEDEKITQKIVKNLIESEKVQVTIASTGKETRDLINEKDYDCIILDLGLPDISGIEFLTELKNRDNFHTPVIVHTDENLAPEERAILDHLAESILLKDTKFKEKILDGTTLFLHRIEAHLPEEKRKMIRRIHDREAILENKKILVVDDDMRNVFALINILEGEGLKPIVAKNGLESLAILNSNPDTDLVLMDIMMPEMDGYTAMKEIRKLESKLRHVPIIALTAKAMKGDRGKCIRAGASDYLAKPVDEDKLLSMLRVWLY